MPPRDPPKSSKIHLDVPPRRHFGQLKFRPCFRTHFRPILRLQRAPHGRPSGALPGTKIDAKLNRNIDRFRCRVKIPSSSYKSLPGPPLEWSQTPQERPKTTKKCAQRRPKSLGNALVSFKMVQRHGRRAPDIQQRAVEPGKTTHPCSFRNVCEGRGRHTGPKPAQDTAKRSAIRKTIQRSPM